MERKFTVVPECRRELIDTGSATLYHPVSDSYWGTGNNGKGEDMFSQLLTKIRSSILDDTTQVAKQGPAPPETTATPTRPASQGPSRSQKRQRSPETCSPPDSSRNGPTQQTILKKRCQTGIPPPGPLFFYFQVWASSCHHPMCEPVADPQGSPGRRPPTPVSPARQPADQRSE